MAEKSPSTPANFGTVLGIAPGEVPVYSSHYPTVDEKEMPDRESYRNYVDGFFMGYKWQCVELARRWLYINKGYVFDNVPMAYDIFDLRSVRVIKDNSHKPLRSFANGSRRRPEPGCLLIWNPEGDFLYTGHVAIVTEVDDHYIRFIEQNVDHVIWGNIRDYSRQLRVTLGPQGEYHIDAVSNNSILGWVIQTDDDTFAEKHIYDDPQLYHIQIRQLDNHGELNKPWLDPSQPDEAAYISVYGCHMNNDPEFGYSYVSISEATHKKLKHATHELHAMFLNATHIVMESDALLEHFNIPKALWIKLRQSWNTRSDEALAGRFDFCISPKGLKVYEYNIDSSSCFMETGKIQLKWAKQLNCQEGWCPGELLFPQLIEAWKVQNLQGTVHIMLDDAVPEETYHALFMKTAIEAAGLRCQIIEDMSTLTCDSYGRIFDEKGEEIRVVWKTWAWETAVQQLREACVHQPHLLENECLPPIKKDPLLVADVLFSKQVRVYEPLWTLVTNNKAMLAVLYQLFPDHPYLLPTHFELTEELRKHGYVTKPFSGIGGSNIHIYNHQAEMIAETKGKFAHHDKVYQSYFPPPVIEGHHIQINAFVVDGKYAGTSARIDPSPVIGHHSNLLSVRVVKDG